MRRTRHQSTLSTGLYEHSGRCYSVTLSSDRDPIVRVANDLYSALNRQTGSHTRAAVALCFDHLQFHHLRLARLPESELVEAVRWKVSQECSLEKDAFTSDICSVVESESKGDPVCDVVAVQADNTHIDRTYKLFAAHCHTLAAVDTVPGAIARCFLGDKNPETSLNQITIVVFCENDRAWLLACVDGELGFVHPLTTPAVASTDSQTKTTDDGALLTSNFDLVQLLREVRAGLHYILERFGDTHHACVGTILTVGNDEHDLLWTLNKCTGIEFRDLQSLVRPDLQRCLNQLPQGLNAGAVSIAFGMALHPATLHPAKQPAEYNQRGAAA